MGILGSMRLLTITSRTLLLALVLPVTACGHPMQRKLEGRWLGEAVENVDPERVAAATGWTKGLSMEFAGDHVTIAIAAEDPRSGKYEVARVHKNDVYLSIQARDGRTSRAHFKLDDERSLRWMIGEGRAVVLRREL